MIEKLIAYLQSRVNLTDEDIVKISSVFSIQYVKKNEHIYKEGELCTYSAYIIKGCFRYYKKLENDEEHITHFAFEDWWLGDVLSILNNTPVALNLQAIEDSILLVISKYNYQDLLKNCPGFAEATWMIRNRSYSALTQLSIDKSSKTAEQRYIDLITKHPAIFQRVSLKYIASYLGIKAESLSRIRRKITAKQ